MVDEELSILRIVDANLNRASEGLRVAEEHARFVLNDVHLSQEAKTLRHALAEASKLVDDLARLTSREAQRDVGLEVTLESEYDRETTQDIGIAAMKRVQQALRCIEEYGKRLNSELAGHCEQLRYRAYTLERALHTTLANQSRLQNASLYVLIDGREDEDAFVRLAKILIDEQVDVLQLRDKSLTDRTLLARARCLRKLTSDTQALMIVNDRPDIAALVGADGVHVGQDELPVYEVRRVVGAEMLVGVSTHSISQARTAVMDGASYIGCGPTFPSSTKSFDAFPGLDYLREVNAEIGLPAFAIGGIGPDNVSEVQATGVRRIAVSGAVVNHANPADVVASLRAALSQPSARE